jgi:hypothetical protein
MHEPKASATVIFLGEVSFIDQERIATPETRFHACRNSEGVDANRGRYAEGAE